MNGCKEKTTTRKEEDDAWDLIHAYSRAEAIAEGVLVDVSEVAGDIGWNVSVALTQAVYESCVRVPTGAVGTEEEDRLRGLLRMVGIAAAAHVLSTGAFSLTVSAKNLERRDDAFTLKVVCAPGDDGEPVVTVMFSHED